MVDGQPNNTANLVLPRMESRPLLPRWIRRKDAAPYLGISTYTFDREVRPYLREIPIGKQSVAFERVDIDTWADHHSEANGRPARKEDLCPRKRVASQSGAKYGGSTNGCTEYDFEKALELVTTKRPKDN